MRLKFYLCIPLLLGVVVMIMWTVSSASFLGCGNLEAEAEDEHLEGTKEDSTSKEEKEAGKGDDDKEETKEKSSCKSPFQMPSSSISDELEGRFDLLNPELGPNGELFFEGDIVVGDDELRDDLLWDVSEGRKFLGELKRLWPIDPDTLVPTIPYVIDKSAEVVRDVILRAMAMWEDGTCVTFRPHEGHHNVSHLAFVRLKGCWSYLGRQYRKPGPQNVSVDFGCTEGTVVHELGHALGLLHEHSRSDRNQHIKVLWENILPRKRRNFRKRKSINIGVPYDYTSIMHYGAYYFSERGDPTLMTRNPFHQHLLGQRVAPSFRDILAVNIMYYCRKVWEEDCGTDAPRCENGGYLGKTCTCVCPPGTDGLTCAHLSGSYYPSVECGGNVTNTTTITPTITTTTTDRRNLVTYPPNFVCMWWGQAGQCQLVTLNVTSFSLLPRNRRGICKWATFEVRTVDPLTPGKVYCSNEISPGQTFSSEKRDLFIVFQSPKVKYEYFSATFNFVNDTNCDDNYLTLE